MAFRCSPVTSITLFQEYIIKKRTSSNRALMLAQPYNHFTIRSALLSSKSSFNNKVFEDPSNGIICYIDEYGEMICEGYDEGPRLHHQQLTRLTCTHRNNDMILDMLERSWLQETADSVTATKFSAPIDLSPYSDAD